MPEDKRSSSAEVANTGRGGVASTSKAPPRPGVLHLRTQAVGRKFTSTGIATVDQVRSTSLQLWSPPPHPFALRGTNHHKLPSMQIPAGFPQGRTCIAAGRRGHEAPSTPCMEVVLQPPPPLHMGYVVSSVGAAFPFLLLLWKSIT